MESSVSVFTSHPSSATVKTRAFVARWIEPEKMNEHGGRVPDPEGTPRWRVTGSEQVFLDDVANPTTLTMQMSNDAGDWKLLVAGWGPNLIPVFGTADYTIIR